ncbi:MobA/MobL family protein [Rhizobium sp. VS19-DR96]|uniref:MobA/MobL family protein n=1 Tax=unclassified Rhizobium TaxID=2613769 RepID=UPI00398C69F2
MGDVRNHHAHVMMTTRQVSRDGLGDKTYMELANKELLPRDLPTTQMQLVDIRRSWEQMANRELARAGLNIRIDHRSHSERGLEIEPTEHRASGRRTSCGGAGRSIGPGSMRRQPSATRI